LRAKTDRLFWCFVDFEKEFDSSKREALWFKMRKLGVSDGIGDCIKIMHQDTTFCVKCGETLISLCATQTEGIHRDCGLSPYLFNIFVTNVTEYLDAEQTRCPVINTLQIPRLLLQMI
jgi:hypothetical protein